ncbi:MAG: transmembrane anchor protein [Gammaproteobacteria bacterium]
MFNSQLPSADELPTSRQLLRSTVIALAVALLLLVTVVMPAEYAIDPTGVGRLLGMTQMGEVKQAIAEENSAPVAASSGVITPAVAVAPAATVAAAAPESTDASPSSTARQDEISITLQPGQGAEVKLEMKQGAQVNYLWTADGGKVNYDTHGDPYGAPRDFYHGYGKGKQTAQDEGVLTAAFDGKHGWFWRNRGDAPVTVTLRVSGDYIDIKRVI